MNDDIVWHAHAVTRGKREVLLSQRGCLVWLTGLSGSGKSTIAGHVESLLYEQNKLTYLLDGDNIRHGLNADLGFSQSDRDENLRRIAHVASLMVDMGAIVLAAFISPLAREREQIRTIIGDHDYLEVFVDTPLETCEKRDPKGLYQKARHGEIQNFTGISAPYERPENPDLVIDTERESLDNASRQVFDLILTKKGKI